MKSLIAGLTLSAIIAPQAALALSPIRGTRSDICYREEYVEVYHPGTRYRRGYVRTDLRRVRVPCRRATVVHPHPVNPYIFDEHDPPNYTPTHTDDNSCVEGAIIGGILGGAAVAAGSRGPDMAWAIPLGVVGGGLVGCQIDGG